MGWGGVFNALFNEVHQAFLSIITQVLERPKISKTASILKWNQAAVTI